LVGTDDPDVWKRRHAPQFLKRNGRIEVHDVHPPDGDRRISRGEFPQLSVERLARLAPGSPEI
jgi:hypothetical protein